MKDTIPVILVRGFLDAGKTTWINHMAASGRLDLDHLLVLSCEDGETAFDNTVFQEHTTFIHLEDESQLKQEYLCQVASCCHPSVIVIECNTMWKMIEFEFPENWETVKRIAVLSAPTLGLYLDNMRALLGPMLSRCDEILINRCSPDVHMLSPCKAKLRPLLDNISNVTIESQNGHYGFDAIEDIIPYKIDQNVITVTPEDYVFWYYDCQDHRDRYEGKQIILNASVKKTPHLNSGEFALGRIAITCCEADMSFLGYLAHYDKIALFPQYASVHARAMIHYRFIRSYNAVMPYLEILSMDSVSESYD